MVRTHRAHRYRPRVQFSTPKRDGAGTSRAAAAHSPDQVTETPPSLAPASVSKEAQASEPPSRRYQTRVGPQAPSPMHPRPRWRAPPSKRARVSHHGLGSSRRLLHQIRVRRPSYPHIQGSHVRCSAAIRFLGTSIFVPGTSMESHTTTYRH